MNIKITKFFNCLINPKFYKSYFYGVSPLFELKNIIKNVEKCNSLIDVGSNKGQFSILFRSFFKYSQIYSFEPQGSQLMIQKKILGKKNIKYYKFGISSKVCKKKFYITKRKDSSSVHFPKKLYNKSYEIIQTKIVNMISLDSFFKKKKLKKPIVLKIDIQGHEFEALKGARKFLNSVEYLIIEISLQQIYENQISSQKIENLLSKYSFFKILETNISYYKNKILQKDVLFKKIR